jgi:putative addiction module antidote
MVTATVRKVGNSLVVTLPKDEAERLGVVEGDQVSLEVRKLEVRPALPGALGRALREELDRSDTREALTYLAER